MKLRAVFSGKLPEGLCLSFSQKELSKIKLSAVIDLYEVIIKLTPYTDYAHKNTNYRCLIYNGYETEITVSGDVDCYYNHFKKINKNELISYYLDKEMEYTKVATEALNRLLLYFKYELNNPISDIIKVLEFHFDDRRWLDENYKELMVFLDDRKMYSVKSLLYMKELGVIALDKNNIHKAEKYIENPREPTFYDTLLASARVAVMSGNINRSILEMAITAESIVKGHYFGKGALSGSIYDYLESKRKVEVSVPELIHHASKYALGVSFKDHSDHDFNNIAHLFQARNKVAHQGVCYYRNDKGKKIEISNETVLEFWESLLALIKWVKSN